MDAWFKFEDTETRFSAHTVMRRLNCCKPAKCGHSKAEVSFWCPETKFAGNEAMASGLVQVNELGSAKVWIRNADVDEFARLVMEDGKIPQIIWRNQISESE